MAAVVLAGLAAPAAAAPITSHIQPPLPAGSIAVVERGSVEIATDGPAPEGADETTLVATTMVSAAPHRRVTLSAMFDYMWRNAELTAPGGARVDRTARGIGDLTLMASSPLEVIAGVIAAPFAGIKVPTGHDDQTDAFGRLPQRLQVGTGAFDVPAGVLAYLTGEPWALYAAMTYTFRSEAHEFDAGDSLRWDVAAQRSLDAAGVDLDVALESHIVWRAADRGTRAPAESGGVSWFLAPAMRGHLDRHALELAVEVPVVQPFDQHVDLVIRAGYRLEIQ